MKHFDNEFEYRLPAEVKEPFETFEKDIFKYGLFKANNKIWMLRPDAFGYCFEAITNFDIEILLHLINDENPSVLLKIKNTNLLAKVIEFDVKEIENLKSFEIQTMNLGNFIFKGNKNDFFKLKVFLFDKMAIGKKIETLGHHADGFWVWNNLVELYNGETLKINENGIFKYKDTNYYVPSANKEFKYYPYKYENQKKFIHQISTTTLASLLMNFKQVYKEDAITAILFAIASYYQDIIVDELNFFPLLSISGKNGSGKSELANNIQSFWGISQTPKNLEGSATSVKKHIISLSQFKNGIQQFSEYKKGDDRIDSLLKGIWDRSGYQRATISGKQPIQQIPILSSLILTGQNTINCKILSARTIPIVLKKNIFTEHEYEVFKNLKEKTEQGISAHTSLILKNRIHFKNAFIKHQKESFLLLNTSKTFSPRIINNYAVLAATYFSLEKYITFPFSKDEMIAHFKNCINSQTIIE